MHGASEDRDALLSRLIDHYRDVGWWIERPEIAGIDLRLRRDAQVLLLACADPGTPVACETIDFLRRCLAGEAADGLLLVAPAGLDADAVVMARGVDGLRLLDRAALQGLLGDEAGAPSPIPAMPAAAPALRNAPLKYRTTGLDLLFRTIAVLCAIGFVIAVLVLLSRTAGTAGEPPPDSLPASAR